MPTPHDQLLSDVRDPNRIRSSNLIARLVEGFEPLDSPDGALIAGHGLIAGFRVLVLGQEKPSGGDPAQAEAVSFGMMGAVGYWFVVEQLERAAADALAVLTFIDTPGADPSKLGVEQLLAWAVSASISSFIAYPGPTVSVVIGEGGSGGALALQVADRRLMVSDAFYSVISPESCSAILFRDHDHIPEAMQVLKPGAKHVLEIGVIDEIVDWPKRVAVKNHDRAATLLQPHIKTALTATAAIQTEQRLADRSAALMRCGRLRTEAEPRTATRVVPSRAAAPARVRFVDASIDIDSDDHSIASLRQAYFEEQGLDDWMAHESDLLCRREGGGCGAVFSSSSYHAAGWACPQCGRGERLGAPHWVEILTDAHSFEELWADLDLPEMNDPVYDNETYRRQRETIRRRTGASGSMCVGIGLVEGARCALTISDFRFMGGTLGAVAGEKIRLIAGEAHAERLPLVSLVCSGGVRMQDGTLGLVQMAKSNAAVQKLLDAGLPHIVILADPCTGGALASYATCATTIIAEPRALLAFAGPRVLHLAGLPVDESQLVAETYARHGGVDEVVPRKVLRSRLRRYIDAATSDRVAPAEAPSAAQRQRAITRRRVSAWFGEIRYQLANVIDGARGLIEEEATELVQANVVSELATLARVEIPSLLAKATQSGNARVRASAVAALATLPQAAVRIDDAVERALDDHHHRVRAEAALGLLRRTPDHVAAVATVERLLGSDDAATRRHGLYVATGAPLEIFEPEIRRLCEDTEAAVRLAAGVAAAASGALDLAVEVIQPLIGTPTSPKRWRVVPLLAIMSPDMADLLRARLELD